MKKLSYFLPILLLVGVGLIFKYALIGYSFLAYGLFFVAFVIFVYFLFSVLKKKYPRPVKLLYTIFTYGLILLILASVITEATIIGEIKTYENNDAEYAIVFGAGVNGTTPSRSLKARLEAAEKFAKKHPETKIIVSGGQGSNEDISEAECMKNWLVANGIDKEQIIEEPMATSTYENVAYSYAIIKGKNEDFHGTVCLITEGYHVLRTKLIAKDFDLETIVSTGYTGLPILTANYYFREIFAVWKYFVFERGSVF